MRDERERRPRPADDDEDGPGGPTRDRSSFLTGLVIGAAVGAGLALLFAPASGEETRRIVRKRGRALARDAREGVEALRAGTGRTLREKKEALRERLAQGLDDLGEELGV
ncbi:MAG: YtxH domain-containing protein [Gemmatimonadales bacterium]|jgi:gas vesicle protein|nr:YtxH domain-containing protein [Gemmatimonadota bacterium]MBK7349314.1 YtxH domain-containing protein [Gemmatimonadota bacterium]MBK7783942.1 YtxH domain-containing protein [Gemmatimonadota bacterium]MBK9068011.1 YtxH domain-containing protein [Gemmatimonadota bacterium]MBP6669432.1 YtxH domain-containing protein [Gemmatimonadales bacterium]